MIISATVFALVSLSSPTGATSPVHAPTAAYAGDTIAHMKGHAAPARPVVAVKAGPAAACHPEPSKGRACRHHAAQAEEARRAERSAEKPALAVAVREPAR